MTTTQSNGNHARVQATQGLRRSNAAGTHPARKARREGSRSAARRGAIARGGW